MISNNQLFLVLSNSFERDYRKMKKRGYNTDDLWKVVELLVNQKPLPVQMRDHQLQGKYKRQRECHIHPDWILIYSISSKELILNLIRTGTHTDLFKM